MKVINLVIQGKQGVPLMMHSNQAVDPLNPYHEAMKQLSGKRNKTNDDLALLGRIEWESGIYVSPETRRICIPAANLEKCFILGARKSKDGKKFEEGVYVLENFCDLKIDGAYFEVNGNGEIPNPSLDKLFVNPKGYVDRRPVRVQRNTVMRSRPVFRNWELFCTVAYDESVINESNLLQCIKVAGEYVGLCEMRPRYGRFDVEVVARQDEAE